MTQVDVRPELIRWARERSGISEQDLAEKFAKYPLWEQGRAMPTFRQLEALAQKTHTPLGYFFLDNPPEESLPIQDFRTLDGNPRPSVDLLETIYQCQDRQDWYHDWLVQESEEPVRFVGSANLSYSPEKVAGEIRERIDLQPNDLAQASSSDDALALVAGKLEGAGILVMRNGIVGNDTHRRLRVDEFRGFALSDEYAPLVFVNAADSKSAQLFTLIHETAHIWLGESAVSDTNPGSRIAGERFCNAVAAETLVPIAIVRGRWDRTKEPLDAARSLSRRFKVSLQVILIRALDAKVLDRSTFDELYALTRDRHVAPKTESSGGDFYRTQSVRLGKRFTDALIASTLEGRTTYTAAMNLLGIKKLTTFDEMARRAGIVP